LIIAAIGIAAAGCAGSSGTQGVKQVNTTADNVAIKGYDTVAYFAANAPVEGNPEFAFVWNGAKWLFSSADNLEKFKADPAKFAPQFGGYCSWAVSHGYTANGDPTAWKVVEGKLYFNYNMKVKEKWEAEQDTLIKEGQNNWTNFKKKKPEHKG
jgi:YHS domain-containing protein